MTITSTYTITLGNLNIDVLNGRALWDGRDIHIGRMHAVLLSHLAAAGEMGRTTSSLASLMEEWAVTDIDPTRDLPRIMRDINRWSVKNVSGKLVVSLVGQIWVMHGNCGETAKVVAR